MNSKHAENMNRFYSRKWQGHKGYWLDVYPPTAQVYALSLAKARNDAIDRVIPDELERVIDVGCGIGDLMLSLSRKSQMAIGLDIAEVNVRMARQNLLNDGIANAVVLQGSAEELPFTESSFDVVLMADVIEHVQDIHAALCETSRVLREDGLFICVTPHAGLQTMFKKIDAIGLFPLELVRMLRGKVPLKNEYQVYERFPSPKTLKECLERSGMTPISYRRICFYPGPEGGGMFGRLMAISYRLLDARRFAMIAQWLVNLFAIIERLQIFNQKQFWIVQR